MRSVRAHLTLQGYDGSWLDMRSNTEYRELEDLQNMEDLDALRRGIARLVVDHNLVDFDGAALVIGPDGAGLTSEEVYGALSAYVTALRERNAVPKDDAAS